MLEKCGVLGPPETQKQREDREKKEKTRREKGGNDGDEVAASNAAYLGVRVRMARSALERMQDPQNRAKFRIRMVLQKSDGSDSSPTLPALAAAFEKSIGESGDGSDVLSGLFSRASDRFDARLNKAFNVNLASLTEEKRLVMKTAVASLLGGLTRASGQLLVKDAPPKEEDEMGGASGKKSKKKKSKRSKSKEPARRRLPHVSTLFSGSPSRSFFPRGFLWDDGFHALVFLAWSRELFYEVFLSWMGLQGAESGWIPREVPLGVEAEIAVPDQFLGQEFGIANPPTLLLGVRALLKRFGGSTSADDVEERRRFTLFARRIIPHVSKWIEFWHTTQRREEKKTVVKDQTNTAGDSGIGGWM